MVDRSGGQAARGDRPHKTRQTYFKRRSDRLAKRHDLCRHICRDQIGCAGLVVEAAGLVLRDPDPGQMSRLAISAT